MSLHRLRRADTVPAVGREIDAYCTRCRLDLGHVITAMDGAVVVQVRCRTCGSVHRFRREAAAAAASAPRSPRSPAAPKVSAAASPQRATLHARRYEKLMLDRDRGGAHAYSPGLNPSAGDLIRHARFGVGVVDFIDAGKAHVVFEDEERVLVVGR